MPLDIGLPDSYGLVLLVASSSFFVNTYHVFLTSAARKRSGLKYPIPYASTELAEKDPNAYQFNCGMLTSLLLPFDFSCEYCLSFFASNRDKHSCSPGIAQRAHSNFTENHPSAMGAMLIAGLKYPTVAATIGGAWVIARFIYAYGYTSGKGPQGRML